MRKHEKRLTTIAIQNYELWKNYAFDSIVFAGVLHLSWKTRCCYLCKKRRRYDHFSNVFLIKFILPMKKKLPAQFSNVFLIKSILPMKKKLTASQQTAQPDACTISCTASCVWWNCFVNFHRLRIIIPGAPLTCNTPAAAPPETKKTTLANSVIIKHDIIALGSRFFETKNVPDVLPWLNFF